MENQFDQLATALCEFQSKMFAVGKNKEGYGYQYTTLGKVIEFAYPVMTDLGLSVSQVLDQAQGQPAVTTVLMHKSGQVLSGTYPIAQAGMKGVNNAQQFGAAISYARRYGLLSVLGLASDDDDAHCLNEAPADVKKAADALSATATAKLTKKEILRAVEKSLSVSDLGALYREHSRQAKSGKWDKELQELCSIRKSEMGGS